LRRSGCPNQKKIDSLEDFAFIHTVSLLSGHAVPSASSGGEAAGDRTTDPTTQEGSKSMLVMSGGEGYIDFRMGELTSTDGNRRVLKDSM